QSGPLKQSANLVTNLPLRALVPGPVTGTPPDPGEQPRCRGDQHDGHDADDYPVVVCAGAASVVVGTEQIHCPSSPSSASWMGRSHRARTGHPATSGNRPDPVRTPLDD